MKAYFIGNKYDGCFYARCLQPLIHNGWDGERTSLRSPKANYQQMTQGALNADVVVFQRPDDPKKLEAARLLKQAGKKIVFDNDDTYKPNSGTPTIMQDLNGALTLERMNDNLVAFMKEADLVTTTTEFLAAEYREHNQNVIILPNQVDPDDWDEPLRNESDKVRIGFVGSVLANNDYKAAESALQVLSQMPNVQIVIFGLPPKEDRYQIMQNAYKDEYKYWWQYNIEWQHQVRMADYFDTLNNLKLDLMLIPREESYFNKCKSNIKFLEAAMLEIPVIASSFSDGNSPYDKDLDGHNGVLVKTGEDWLKKILALVENKKLRRKMGKAAKKYVLDNYNIHKNYHRWEAAYNLL